MRIHVTKEGGWWLVAQQTPDFVAEISGYRVVMHRARSFDKAWRFVDLNEFWVEDYRDHL